MSEPNDLTKMAINIPPDHLRTAADVIKAIPRGWHKAEICVASSIGRLNRIVRVSLHKNRHGRKVILIHDDDFQ